MITNVFGAKLHYYAFCDLQHIRELAIKLLKASCKSSAISADRANYPKEKTLNSKRGKDVDRLIFRLMNYYQVKKPVFIGNGLGYTKAYMVKVNPGIKLCCIGDCIKNEEISPNIFKRQLKINNIAPVHFKELESVDFVVISNFVSIEDIELFKMTIDNFWVDLLFLFFKT